MGTDRKGSQASKCANALFHQCEGTMASICTSFPDSPGSTKRSDPLTTFMPGACGQAEKSTCTPKALLAGIPYVLPSISCVGKGSQVSISSMM